ncbi:MAG: NYN domain-containing protein [Verrucomicrobia bacterium]|jgi:PIN domain|nr:MAG: NYN domain-containing protein [Verrucomicrobiota bacterium]
MPPEAVEHFVFVDFENVPSVDLSLVATQSVHVTLLVGKTQRKLDTALVGRMLQLGKDKVALIEMGASGRNALDFTLAFYLGQSALRHPAAHYYIVSKDKDFDPLISHLYIQEVMVTRVASFDALPFLARSKKPATPVGKPAPDKRTKLIARLQHPENPARPSTRKALLAHIKTALGKESTDAKVAETLRELQEKNVLAIDTKDVVSYVPTPRYKS